MSQQGGRPTRHEDDWWGQLYDDSTEDTGPTAAPDSLDDRFASAKNTVAGQPGGTPGHTGGTAPETPRQEPPREPAVPPQRAAPPPPSPSPSTPPSRRAPWEPPPADAGAPGAWPPVAGRADRRAEKAPAPAGDVDPEVPGAWPPVAGRADGRVEEAAASAGSAESGAPGAWPPVPGRADGRAEKAPAPAGDVDPGAPGAWPPVPGRADGRTQKAPAPARSAEAEVTRAWPPVSGSAEGQVEKPEPAPADRSAVPPEPDPTSEASERPEASRPPVAGFASAPPVATQLDLPATSAPPPPPSSLDYVGSGPPTYDPEPTALPVADPDELGDLVADTVLDGARYGSSTLRAVSLRGDSARYRGEPRRDALLTARFGTGEQALVLVAMATGARATPGAHLAAAEACWLIGRAVGRSHQRLVADIRAARRGDLKSGLHRLTDRSLGKLRASAVEQDLDPEDYSASLRCLLLPADPDCRTRVFFGVGEGGLFRLRDGEWQDIEPRVSPADTTGEPVLGFGSPPAETPEGDRLTMDLGIPTPPSPYEPAPEPPREPFRFRASVARPGDVLVMGTGGLADPLRGEPALCAYLARRWSGRTPPGLAAFLADTQVRVKGYSDDRTAAAVWEA
ncbi:protein phosphatase 2C domain-containing protein [Streptomyces diastatochromogenes]|uniref:protein phosphatase 2C domain-containing protein n=1 Tax=Streptomyces diastatochromogenes TaxID=42236 RepID=UPI000B91AC81|nr:protein phosphatase 2C domain-containing protein [Streptomyces diastatochromogenes]